MNGKTKIYLFEGIERNVLIQVNILQFFFFFIQYNNGLDQRWFFYSEEIEFYDEFEKIPINLLMVSRWLKVVKMTEISACLQINSQALAPSVSYKGTILKLYPIRTSREEGIPESDFPRYSSWGFESWPNRYQRNPQISRKDKRSSSHGQIEWWYRTIPCRCCIRS